VAGKAAASPVFTGPVPLARLRLTVPSSGQSVAHPVAPSWRVHAHFGGGTAVAAWGDAVYSVGTDTWLRVRTASHGTPLHAACLGRLPLSCVALLPLAAGAQPGSRPSAVVGSLDGYITIVSVDYGVTRAHWGAHDDAVSALAIAPGAPGGPRVVSAGWDGNLKVWDVSHARGPLATVAPASGAGGPTSPLVDLPGADGRLWSLCCDDVGVRLLAGTATGAVACYDSRQHPSSGPAWHVTATGGGGVCALACDPTASCCLVAGEDGLLRLLDARKAGAQVASVDVGHGLPCRCVTMAGGTVFAGTDGGQLVAWDTAAVAPGLVMAPERGGTRPGVTPWHPFGESAGDSLCGVAVGGDSQALGAAVVVALSTSGAMRGYAVPHGWDTHAAA
jgi:WD40 repeat protein